MKKSFYQAMEQTVAYLTGHVPVSILDLVKFLPLEEQPAHVSKGNEEERTCETNAAADEAIPSWRHGRTGKSGSSRDSRFYGNYG